MAKPQRDGFKGMMAVYVALQKGGAPSLAGYYAHFDIMVRERIRLEVKTCTGLQRSHYGRAWQFNISRHGKISEETDFYVLRLENVPLSKAAITLLLKAPLRRSTIVISTRQLLEGKWTDAIKDWRRFVKDPDAFFPAPEPPHE